MATFTNKKFYCLDPRPEDIHIVDIAHSLSMKCRFNGHSDRFYSVAEHSMAVANQCSPENKLYGLLHDAAEAYLPDIPRPVKYSVEVIANQIREIEHNIMRVILNKYGLKDEIPDEVREVDSRMCLTEGNMLMKDTSEWDLRWKHKPYDMILYCMGPRTAKNTFLSNFKLYQSEEIARGLYGHKSSS